MHSSIVIIDHAIYDPVHGKDFYMVKIISDVYKEFLIDTMNNIQSIKVQESNGRIYARYSTVDGYFSLANNF